MTTTEKRERKLHPRPSLLDMARVVGDLDARQTATFRAADEVFTALAGLYGLTDDNSFEAIEGRARQRFAEHRDLGNALALIADCMPDEDEVSAAEPMLTAERVTARLHNYAERIDDHDRAERGRRTNTEAVEAARSMAVGAMVDAYTESERALRGDARFGQDAAEIRVVLDASPRQLATSVHALAAAYTAALVSDAAYGRLDTGTQDLDLFDGDEFSTPAALVEAVLVKLRDADDLAGKLDECMHRRDEAQAALHEVGGHLGLDAGAKPASIVLESHSRAQAWADLERAADVAGVRGDTERRPFALAAAVGNALRANTGAAEAAGKLEQLQVDHRVLLDALAEIRGHLGLDASAPPAAVVFVSQAMARGWAEIEGTYQRGYRPESVPGDSLVPGQLARRVSEVLRASAPNGAVGEAQRRVDQINADALTEIAGLVMVRNPRAAEAGARTTPPYAHEIVTAVKDAREVLRAALAGAEPAEYLAGEALVTLAEETSSRLWAWRDAGRHMLVATATRPMRPAAVLSEVLTPAQVQQRVEYALEQWQTEGKAMLRATMTEAQWADVGEAHNPRQAGAVRHRVVTTLDALRESRAEAETFEDASGPVFDPSVVALLRAACELDPTGGGNRAHQVPDSLTEGGKTLAVWRNRMWISAWLMHRALAAVDGTEGPAW